MPTPFEPFGDAALRFAVPDGADAAQLLDALRSTAGVTDAVVGERHAVVTFEPGREPVGLSEVLEQAASRLRRERVAAAPRQHVVRVVYDGADLDEVAARSGMPAPEVVRLHTGAAYEVAAVGFLPGFAYLRGLHPRLVGPRRGAPRSRVPAQSVAIAGPYAGVYPFASPGGWQLLGTAVAFSAFTPLAGATLALGDAVRFVQVEP